MKKHILICDDDSLLVELVTFRLETRGFQVDVARDGGEALEKMRQAAPDAVVLDLMMPVLQGPHVLREMQQDASLRDIPVVVLSARRKQEDIVGALELGADDYLIKPFIPEELISRITRLVGRD